MGLLTWVSLTLAAFALCFCAFLWLELQKRVSAEGVRSLLQRYSEELSKDYARQFHAIETEWDDMYQKFGRLAGRMDRSKAITPKGEEPPTPPEPVPASRADILKQWRNRA